MKWTRLGLTILLATAAVWAADNAAKPAAPGAATTQPTSLDVGKGITMTLVRVPAGKFSMGSSNEGERDADETPHEVVISQPYYLGATEVTQEQYEAVMGAPPSCETKGPQNPADSVTFLQATDFCKKLSQKSGKTIHLPTEAQWEYAARAGTKTRFYYGDDASKLGDYAWYTVNRTGKTHPVGQKTPNAWGFYDMCGNVYEWVSDYYDSYPKEATTNPAGPDKGDFRVLRGGCWTSDPKQCRSAFRCRVDAGGAAKDAKPVFVGFRVAMDP